MRCSRTFVDTADSKRGALVIIIEVIFDALFAAVAAVGFSAISDPPTYAFSRIAVLAALGHALRFVLIKHGFDIATVYFRICGGLCKPCFGEAHNRSDDGSLRAGAAANGSGNICV